MAENTAGTGLHVTGFSTQPGALASSCYPATYAEHKCWDPKDGELCLARLKSGETLMEDRSDSDVQINRRSWV
jgi:hypothetical protein